MIKIEGIEKNNFHLVNSIEVSFPVKSKLKIRLDENGKIGYDIENTETPYTKSFKHYSDAKEYLTDDNYHGYLAFHKNKLAGQILLQKHWNNLGSIEDIRVATDFQRQGIGSKLIERAKSWAVQKNLKGLRLETQDVNIRACLLYEKAGFTLSGFDSNLYSGLNSRNEIALYWYWFNPEHN